MPIDSENISSGRLFLAAMGTHRISGKELFLCYRTVREKQQLSNDNFIMIIPLSLSWRLFSKIAL